MGRTLDTLRHNESHRHDAHRATPAARIVQPADGAVVDGAAEECITDWTLQQEVPFIEVGAPGKAIEISPLLVKHPAQPKVQPPHPLLGKTLAASRPASVVNLTDAKPMTVAFEAWPGPQSPAGIAPEVIAHHQPEHAVSKEYAALFDKMMQAYAGPGPHTLMLCGLRPHVGTSTVLLNLAVIAARQRRRTVVVGVNLARPGVAARLGHTGPAGIHDVIAGTVAIGSAIVSTAVAALHVLPAGAAAKKRGPLTAEALTWLTAWLRERYDMILLDGPTVEECADLAVLAPSADGIYLVLPQNEAETGTRGIAQNIARMGGRLRGLIHTHFEA